MSAILAPEPAVKKKYTADDLLQMPDGDLYELLDGELVERSMGAESAFLSGEIFHAIRTHAKKHDLGWVFPDGTNYECFGSPHEVKRPDVSFIKKGRLLNEQVPVDYITIVPDLVVEVLSPTDMARLVDEKVDEYLTFGVRVVWVVHPSLKMVRIHRLEGPDAQLRGDSILEDHDVLPGFRLSIKELFESLKKK